MPVEEAVKDAERQTYYQGYLESMVAAVSCFSALSFVSAGGKAG